MSRDNFISDNLIKIRENLRQNPVKSPVPGDDNTLSPVQNYSSQEASAGASLRFAPELPQPAPRMQTRAPELDRERRELAGRIRRDYSCAAAELENMEQKRKEATLFLEFLEKHQRELEAVDFNADGASRELDRLTWEYYRLAGRWRAFSSGSSAVGSGEEVSRSHECTCRRTAWLTPVAILIGAAVVSIALLASFL